LRLDATIDDVFDRLMALDRAMGTLTDAERAGWCRHWSTRKPSPTRTGTDRSTPRLCAKLDELREVAC
jgi:hypothetical protein